MKRVIVSAVLLAMIIGLSVWSLCDLKEYNGRLLELCGQVSGCDPGDTAALSEGGRRLRAMWEECESRFVLYVRHDTLDEITEEVSRLEKLALYGDTGSFFSTLDSLTALLEDMERSAIPSYRNLL